MHTAGRPQIRGPAPKGNPSSRTLARMEELILGRHDLLAQGYTGRDLTDAVRMGQLIRIRRDHYALPGLDPMIERAVRVGGRLDCVSALDRAGVWVADDARAHISLDPLASRLRSPSDRRRRLTRQNRAGAVLHWWPLAFAETATCYAVGPIDALAHVIRCQPAPLAIASLDSALEQGIITRESLPEIFAAVPPRFGALYSRIDERAMSGIETLVRLLCEDAGLRYRLQVTFTGIGTVDMLIEDCVVVESDGRAWHEGMERATRDYGRDVELTARGYWVLRFNYWQVTRQPELVLAAIQMAVRMHRRSRFA